MPIYTYHCDSCGVQFDRQQKFSDQPLRVCPECQEEALRKVYQPVGIVFKGSGFYATDNRSSSGMGRNSKKSSSGESSEGTKTKAKKSKGDSND